MPKPDRDESELEVLSPRALIREMREDLAEHCAQLDEWKRRHGFAFQPNPLKRIP
jgi:hypothetical protein